MCDSLEEGSIGTDYLFTSVGMEIDCGISIHCLRMIELFRGKRVGKKGGGREEEKRRSSLGVQQHTHSHTPSHTHRSQDEGQLCVARVATIGGADHIDQHIPKHCQVPSRGGECEDRRFGGIQLQQHAPVGELVVELRGRKGGRGGREEGREEGREGGGEEGREGGGGGGEGGKEGGKEGGGGGRKWYIVYTTMLHGKPVE